MSVFCEPKLWFTFCIGQWYAAWNIVLYLTALYRYWTVYGNATSAPLPNCLAHKCNILLLNATICLSPEARRHIICLMALARDKCHGFRRPRVDRPPYLAIFIMIFSGLTIKMGGRFVHKDIISFWKYDHKNWCHYILAELLHWSVLEINPSMRIKNIYIYNYSIFSKLCSGMSLTNKFLYIYMNIYSRNS